MVNLLLYDEEEFSPRDYARVWDLHPTKLGLSMQKGLTQPVRHDVGTVFVLVSREREHLFQTIIDNYRNAGLNVRLERGILNYGQGDFAVIRKRLRLQRIFQPFDDVEHQRNLQRLEQEERTEAKTRAILAGRNRGAVKGGNRLKEMLDTKEKKKNERSLGKR